MWVQIPLGLRSRNGVVVQLGGHEFRKLKTRVQLPSIPRSMNIVRAVKSEISLTVQCPHCPRVLNKFGIRAHIWQVHEGGNPNRGYAEGTREAWNKGRRISPIDEILVKGRKKPGNLREILIELGRKYECELCFQGGVHNSKPLILQVDHIDGDNKNQERTNLRFLCPNCHTQTDTFGSRNKKQKCKIDA